MFRLVRDLWEALLGSGVMPTASRLPPHPANAPGPFYVEDGCCISCGVWDDVAPDLLAWLEDDDVTHCYVQRQPETDEEFERMMAAMQFGEVDCIRVHACKPDWIERLRKEGLGDQIDPESGPLPRRVRYSTGARHELDKKAVW